MKNVFKTNSKLYGEHTFNMVLEKVLMHKNTLYAW